jgi:hypothetical protein
MIFKGLADKAIERVAGAMSKVGGNPMKPEQPYIPRKRLSPEEQLAGFREKQEESRKIREEKEKNPPQAEEPEGGITLEQGDFGTYLIVDNATGKDILIQTDWDYPGIASTFGWSHEHGETDGTIDCPVCGASASDMINEAQEYLDDHIGDTAEDPGYFDSDEEPI